MSDPVTAERAPNRGGILDTLGELQEKAETALSKARKDEMEFDPQIACLLGEI